MVPGMPSLRSNPGAWSPESNHVLDPAILLYAGVETRLSSTWHSAAGNRCTVGERPISF